MSEPNIKTKSLPKIFVLDTSVILYNHEAIYSFDDNFIAIPITVLEELDNFKKGNELINFEAREFIRILDQISYNHSINEWIQFRENGASVRVILDEGSDPDANKIFGGHKPDHRILNVAIKLSKEFPDRKVILVSKDINLRLKARALNIMAEDYETGKIKDLEKLYTGKTTLEIDDKSIIDLMYKQGFVEPNEIGITDPVPNHYFILKYNSNSVLGYYNPLTQVIEKIVKKPAARIYPRNAEQVFSIHSIVSPNIKLVTLQGVAGTGKTLLALAGALETKDDFKQIYLARPIVPLSNKDIGFLPGDIKSKINPYMEPLYDNLRFIKSQNNNYAFQQNIDKMLEEDNIVIAPLAYIRGRSISHVCFIVDEAQNLTPHEVKTIITRAGEGTKIIFTGDIRQIDTPYLDARSNGLSYLIDRLKGHPIYAHVTLEKGERSELANIANELL
ncbi:MAG: PhoH family protein [Bacteroidales bacterium]|nr:PhoH family protein [Bacteroidales bacterium]